MNACLDAALRYLRHGKAPLVPWKEFQRRRPTRALAVNLYRRWPAPGVAVVCGRISDAEDSNR